MFEDVCITCQVRYHWKLEAASQKEMFSAAITYALLEAQELHVRLKNATKRNIEYLTDRKEEFVDWIYSDQLENISELLGIDTKVIRSRMEAALDGEINEAFERREAKKRLTKEKERVYWSEKMRTIRNGR